MMKKTISLLLALTVCFTVTEAVASTWIGCKVSARILEKQGQNLMIDILSVTDQISGFGACPLKTGPLPSAIVLKVEKYNQAEVDQLTAGQVVLLDYQKGSSSPSKGGRGYEDWRYHGAQK